MLTTLDEYASDIPINADVCIVGAGAAGITIARELIGKNFSVVLLESGGLEFDVRTQSLYDGENVGYQYYPLEAIRLRYFGGTTNHWAGACRPLDEIDFERRPYVENSGWPISRSDLDSYYRRAHDLCGIGAYDYDPAVWETVEAAQLPFESSDIGTAMMRINPARFGTLYRAELESASNVSVYLHANVTDIHIPTADNRVRSVRAQSLNGTKTDVTAKFFVLATGAVENARILLNSNGVRTEGIGNQNDVVGRCFMEHLSLPGADFLISDTSRGPGALYQDFVSDGVGVKGFLVPSAELQRREEILNIRAFISPTASTELAAKSSGGILAAGFIWNDLRDGMLPKNLHSHLRSILTDLDDVAIYSYQKAYGVNAGESTLLCHIEQAPNLSSRVTVTDARDEFGKRRVALDWQFGDLERRTLEVFCRSIAASAGQAGIGRVRLVEDAKNSDWPEGLRGAWHQMGTTRMSGSAATGVVDKHCRVFDTDNLYVAGSSVFATSGYTNPTLTVVALALRLSDEISRQLA